MKKKLKTTDLQNIVKEIKPLVNLFTRGLCFVRNYVFCGKQTPTHHLICQQLVRADTFDPSHDTNMKRFYQAHLLRKINRGLTIAQSLNPNKENWLWIINALEARKSI